MRLNEVELKSGDIPADKIVDIPSRGYEKIDNEGGESSLSQNTLQRHKVDHESSPTFSLPVPASSLPVDCTTKNLEDDTKSNGNDLSFQGATIKATNNETAQTVKLFHPEFMFCGDCTTCSDTIPKIPHPSLPRLKKKKQVNRKNKMVFVPPKQKIHIIEDGDIEMQPPKLQQKEVHDMENLEDGFAPEINNHEQKSCRSSLHVKGICCAAEVPIVTSILYGLNGRIDRSKAKGADNSILNVSVNIPARMLYVQHDPKSLSAQQIKDALEEEGFEATIKRDGGEVSNINDKVTITKRSKYVESTLIIPSLMANCEGDSIREWLMTSEEFSSEKIGVRACFVHIPSHCVKVEHDPSIVKVSDLVNILTQRRNKSGSNFYVENVSVAVDGEAEGLFLPANESEIGLSASDHGNNGANIRKKSSCKNFKCYQIHINIFLSGTCWILSMVGALIDDVEYLRFAGIGAVVFGLPPIVTKALLTLRRFQFDANCMMVTAALGALALQEYDEAASVAFLFSISELLESRASSRAQAALNNIIEMRPDHANLIDPVTNEIIIVQADHLPIGSLVSVRTGDKVPADGIIVEGRSQLDESSLTGEALPIDKKAGDSVSGGNVNVGSTRLVIKTKTSVEDSAVSRLIKLVEDAQSNTSPTAKLIDSFAKLYTPIILFVAFMMCTVPWFFGADIGRHWTLNGLIIIIISCPCSLTISTPVTYAAGLAATAQNGVIVKGGAKLEAIGKVKRIVFDKTGTITEGKFNLLHLEIVGNELKKTRKEVLQLLALMEAPSAHPLSSCLVHAAKIENIEIPKDKKVKKHTVLKGEGVTALINDQRVYVGNSRLFQRIGMFESLASSCKASAQKWSDEGGTVGFLGLESLGIIGMYCVADTVRPEAKDVLSILSKEMDIVMLTGDGEGASRAVASLVGIPQTSVYSQMLPEDKMHFVGNLLGPSKTDERRNNVCGSKELVAMVGDGINDAPALSVADVSIAMGDGAALALEMSDVTLMDCNLEKLLFTIKKGKQVLSTVKENIFISIITKATIILLTFLGQMTLLGAITSDVGIMLIVTINGMKLLPKPSTSCFGCCKKKSIEYNEIVLHNQGRSIPDLV